MRSILFSQQNRKLTMEKKKNQTRRMHGLDEVNDHPSLFTIEKQYFNESLFLSVDFKSKENIPVTCKSRYKKGEILYIAEPMYVKKTKDVSLTALEKPHVYIYDHDIVSYDKKYWKKVSPMFMCEAYGRTFIRIDNIICERVQSITYKDCLAEGIFSHLSNIGKQHEKLIKFNYAALFDKVNNVGDWDKNPFVFAYTYSYLENYNRRIGK